MARINEIKEQKTVVQSVGSFASSLQQIAAGRMTKLRDLVLSSRRFVDEATLILRELQLEQTKRLEKDLGITRSGKPISNKKKAEAEKPPQELKKAIIVVSSDQGLCGSYNVEIQKKVEAVYPDHKDADFFIIGKKGQEFFEKIARHENLHYYPYNIPEEVSIEDLRPLIGMFYYYDQIHLIYSKYINTTTREVVFIELAVPNLTEVEVESKKSEADEEDKANNEGEFIFEPNIDELIYQLSAKLRYALFRQQILDSKLSLYTAQMVAMQTASENAEDLLKELQLEYNKARRKLIDKKIQEVQAGRALWDDE